MVHVWYMHGENIDIARRLFGACVVYVQCIHDQDYSKEEKQTPSTYQTWMDEVSSIRRAALVNNMVLKAMIFRFEKEQKNHRITMVFYFILILF